MTNRSVLADFSEQIEVQPVSMFYSFRRPGGDGVYEMVYNVADAVDLRTIERNLSDGYVIEACRPATDADRNRVFEG